jgi:hypothetical protein
MEHNGSDAELPEGVRDGCGSVSFRMESLPGRGMHFTETEIGEQD